MTSERKDGASPGAPPAPSRTRFADPLGVAATIAAGMFVLSLSWFKLASVDIGYHVAYGSEFLDHGRIVDRDPFLLPSVAEHFVNANWGSQVIMALAYRIAGAGGLTTLRVVLIAAIFGLIGWIVRRATGRWRPVAWTWLVAGLAAYERFTMRPELFSYAVMVAMLALLHGQAITRRSCIALVALQLLWINLHSYFLVGLMLTGAYAVVCVIQRVLASSGPEAAAARKTQARLLAVTLLAQIAVCFVNPWWHRGAMYPLDALRMLDDRGVLASGPEQAADPSPLAAISEFHSPWSHAGLRNSSRTLIGYVVLLALTAVAVIPALYRRRWAELMFLAALVAMSFQMRRNIAQYALAGMPIVACLLSRMRESVEPCPSLLRRAISIAASFSVILFAVLWTVGIVDGRFYFSERRLNREFGAGFSNRSFVSDAASWLARQADSTGVFGPGAGLFVNYNASSNVLLQLGQRFRLMVDTNTFAYKEETLGLAQRLGQGTPRYGEILEKLGISAVLIQCGADADDLVRKLADDFTEWALVYFDRQAVIFVKRTSRLVPLIAANRMDASRLDPQAWINDVSGRPRQRALELGLAAQVPLALKWYDRAAPILKETVKLAPDYDEAWANLGQCHGMLANRAGIDGRRTEAAAELTEAIRCFETALAINPRSTSAAINLPRARKSLESLLPQRP